MRHFCATILARENFVQSLLAHISKLNVFLNIVFIHFHWKWISIVLLEYSALLLLAQQDYGKGYHLKSATKLYHSKLHKIKKITCLKIVFFVRY